MKQQKILPKNTALHSEKAKKVFQGKRFSVYQWRQKQFDGSEATFEVVKRNSTVIVIPVIDGEIVMVKEKQPHWKTWGYTLVAGMANDNEDPLVAARRELQEETGMEFEHFKLVNVDTLATQVEWFAYTFIAYGHKKTGKKHLDAGEKNTVMKVSYDKLVEMVRGRKFMYPPRFLENMIIMDRLKELKAILQHPEKSLKTFKYLS